MAKQPWKQYDMTKAEFVEAYREYLTGLVFSALPTAPAAHELDDLVPVARDAWEEGADGPALFADYGTDAVEYHGSDEIRLVERGLSTRIDFASPDQIVGYFLDGSDEPVAL